ncbi:hypothetical protein FACS1894141_1730 [Spirochaetia bacterium]|nr:hypothetical protein FACS1894141_1730 [Spirochaetia bacterium]
MSKYSALQEYLKNSQNQAEMLSFQQVETILGYPLPDSASKHRPWWANGGHTQAAAWLDVGWEIKSVSLGVSVTFRKTIHSNALPTSQREQVNPPIVAGNSKPPITMNKHLSSQHVSEDAIVLISCVSMKLPHKAKAEDLYTSPLFIKSLSFAKKINPKKIFILSAEHHLLDLDTVIEPYNKTLNDMSDAENKKWAKTVLEQLKNKCDIMNDKFVILAGSNYFKHLIPSLKHCEIPMDGLPIGKRLSWLNEALYER